jgi:hypothetical protein
METTETTREEIERQRCAAHKELTAAKHAFQYTRQPEMVREDQVALTAVEQAQQNLLAAVRKCESQREAHAREAQEFHKKCTEQEEFLRSTAPECIDLWVADLKEELRQTEVHQSNAAMMLKNHEYSALSARANLLRNLITDADGLKLSCITAADAMKRIQKLSQTLPPLE